MSELTWSGTTPPPLKPYGECIMTRTPEGIHIDQADPRILVSTELLDAMNYGLTDQGVTLDSDLLRIEGVNRTVVYRIGAKVPDMYAYYAEWPD